VHHPVLANDGKILLPGYDAASKLYCHYDPEDFLEIAKFPNKVDAQNAFNELAGLLRTFDLEESHDLAAAVCFMLTATCRANLKTAPLVLISAPVAGSGKGLLARVKSLFCSPAEPAAATLGTNEDECKKEIVSRLLEGKPVLFFDELAADEIDSITLRTLATSETLGGRFLGQSRSLNLPTRVLVLMTANNSVPSADSARRIVEIRLNPKCENPALRTFDFDPIKAMNEGRAKYIAAVLTIQRAFILAGSPKPDAPATGSFGDWDRWCRWPIMWLTGIDPATRMHQAIQSDPSKALVVRLFRAWVDSFGSEPVRVSDVVAGANAQLRDVLEELCGRKGEITTNSVGRWLGKHKDRIADGLVLRDAGVLNGNRRWRIDVVPTQVTATSQVAVGGANEYVPGADLNAK
jgi:hypothetical protein